MKVLHVIASPRGEMSRTLQIARAYIDALKEKNAGLEVDELDLYKAGLPDITGDGANATYMALGGLEMEGAIKSYREIATEYAESFLSYDQVVVSSPMWNFSLPYKLKQYIDIIVQPGIMFTYTETGPVGLATGKKVVCITSRGGDYSEGSPISVYDFQETYLKAIFGFCGIYDVSFVNAQPLDFDPSKTKELVDQAKAAAVALA